MGYTYIADEDPGPFAGAVVGMRVQLAALEPPWIVVDHSLSGVVVAHWPGRLFQVATVQPRSPAEEQALDRAAENLRRDAGYSRVVAVDVLEELAPAILFGPHGHDVARIIEVGRFLTDERAQLLAMRCDPDAEHVYRRAWDHWLTAQPDGAAYLDYDHRATLLVPGAGPRGSPIGQGFMVLADTVRQSARQRGGVDAFTTDDDGDEIMSEPWATARASLQHAAMAYGAPELISATDRQILTWAWESVMTNTEPVPLDQVNDRGGEHHC